MKRREITHCTLSPCIAIAGRPFIDNHCSKASAPFLVSTKTRVNGGCNLIDLRFQSKENKKTIEILYHITDLLYMQRKTTKIMIPKPHFNDHQQKAIFGRNPTKKVPSHEFHQPCRI